MGRKVRKEVEKKGDQTEAREKLFVQVTPNITIVMEGQNA